MAYVAIGQSSAVVATREIPYRPAGPPVGQRLRKNRTSTWAPLTFVPSPIRFFGAVWDPSAEKRSMSPTSASPVPVGSQVS